MATKTCLPKYARLTPLATSGGHSRRRFPSSSSSSSSFSTLGGGPAAWDAAGEERRGRNGVLCYILNYTVVVGGEKEGKGEEEQQAGGRTKREIRRFQTFDFPCAFFTAIWIFVFFLKRKYKCRKIPRWRMSCPMWCKLLLWCIRLKSGPLGFGGKKAFWCSDDVAFPMPHRKPTTPTLYTIKAGAKKKVSTTYMMETGDFWIRRPSGDTCDTGGNF